MLHPPPAVPDAPVGAHARTRSRAASQLAALMLSACGVIAGGCGGNNPDSKSGDAAVDAAPADAGSSDAAATDATVMDAAADASAEDAGADASADDASAKADADTALACPAPVDASAAEQNGETPRAQWLYAFDHPHNRTSLVGDPGGGAYVGFLADGGAEAFTLGGDTVHAGGEATRLVGVARFAADGQVDWAHGVVPVVADTQWYPQLPMAADDQGVLLAVPVSSEVNIAGTSFDAPGEALVVMRFTETGADWTSAFGVGADWQTEFSGSGARVVQMAAGGGLTALAIVHEDPLDLGGGARTCSPLILALDSDGQRIFDRCLDVAGASFPALQGLAVDTERNVVVSAFPATEYDVGTGSMTIDPTGGGSVMVKLSGEDGAALWSTEFVRSYANHLGTDDEGRIVCAGHIPTFDDALRIAGRPLSGCEPSDDYSYHVTWLSSDGEHIRTVRMGRVSQLVLSPQGRAYVQGSVGGEPFVPGIDPRTVGHFAALDVDGSMAFVHDLVTMGALSGTMALDGAGYLYVLGDVLDPITLDNGDSFSPEAGYQQVLVRYATSSP